MARLLLIVCFCTISLLSLSAQQKNTVGDNIPLVFYIGEDENNYEKLVQKYNTMLFAVCNNNMELAFDNWTVLLKDLEDFSNKSNIGLLEMIGMIFYLKNSKE